MLRRGRPDRRESFKGGRNCLIYAASSIRNPSVLLSAMEMSCWACPALVLAWWPLVVSICTHIHVLCILAVATTFILLRAFNCGATIWGRYNWRNTAVLTGGAVQTWEHACHIYENLSKQYEIWYGTRCIVILIARTRLPFSLVNSCRWVKLVVLISYRIGWYECHSHTPAAQTAGEVRWRAKEWTGEWVCLHPNQTLERWDQQSCNNVSSLLYTSLCLK